MFERQTTRLALILLSLWAFSGNAAFAQEEDPQAAKIRAAAEEAARQAQERQAAEQLKRDRERSIKSMNEFLTDVRSQIAAADNAAAAQRERERRIQLERFRTAFTAFETAREELSGALDFKGKLKDPARKMAKSTAVFLDFIKRTTKEPSRFDPSEFKDFTPLELGWEALTSAERVTPHLEAVIRAESESSIDVRFLQSLSKLQAQLLRLQWMMQKLK